MEMYKKIASDVQHILCSSIVRCNNAQGHVFDFQETCKLVKCIFCKVFNEK